MHGAAAQSVPVRVGFIPVLGTSQIFVADQLGLLKAAGLTPRFTNFESGPVMIQALASGTLDVYVGGVAPLAVARSKGVEVKVVAATAIEEMTVTIGGKFAPYFKAGTSSADAFKAFHAATGKAARMATQPPGSVPHTTLVHWLDEVAHVPKGDYEIITMGIDATQQALLAGAVDGSTLREPAITVSEQRDPRIKVVAYGAEMFKDQPGTVVAVVGRVPGEESRGGAEARRCNRASHRRHPERPAKGRAGDRGRSRQRHCRRADDPQIARPRRPRSLPPTRG